MPDYIAAVQRVIVNEPLAVKEVINLWLGKLTEHKVWIAVDDPDAYVVTADTIEQAFLIASNYYEEDHPHIRQLPEKAFENFLITVKTPKTPIKDTQEIKILSDPTKLHTPKLQPEQVEPDKWVWCRTDIPHGPSIPGPSHLNEQWFDKLIDGETEGQWGKSPVIKWYFTREHAIADARHAGAPIR